MLRPPALIAAAAVVLLCVGEAAAQTAHGSGTLTLKSEPGDYIGNGKTYSFIGPHVRLGRTPPGLVTVTVKTDDIHRYWSVFIGAPDGGRLEPGTYDDVTRVPEPGHALLNVFGEHRGCGETYGSFTVHDVDYGIRDYVESLNVTFLQRCEELTAPALRGKVKVTAPPPRDPLEVDLTFDPERTTHDDVTSLLTVQGTIRCSRPARAGVRAKIEEIGLPRNGASGNATGFGTVRVNRCSTTPTHWALNAESVNGFPFTGGDMTIQVATKAKDEWWTAYLQESVYARDAASTHSVVVGENGRVAADLPPTDNAGGFTGFVARHSVAALLVTLGALIFTVLAAVAATLLVARRRGGSSTPRS